MKKKSNRTRSGGWIFVRKWMMKMKIVFIFLLCSLMQVQAAVHAQQSNVSLELKNVTLEKVFQELERQTDYSFLYNYREVAIHENVSIQAENQELKVVLENLLPRLGLSYSFDDNLVIIKTMSKQEPEKKVIRVKGFVYDHQKSPMPGVTVKVVGVAVGTSTNEKGWFMLDLPLQKGALEFSFIGFKKQQVEFSEKAAKDTLRVILKEDVSDLDEVVVRAFGTQNKREVISSISRVTAEEMKELPAASFLSMLQGRVAGMNIVNQSGAPGSQAVVTIRGFNSFIDAAGDTQGASDGQPLYVVDGMPMHSFVSPVTGTNTLADLDPSMIESIEVLKDAAAASIYGSRAGNGVVLITTKKGQAGKTKFSANLSYTMAEVQEYPEMTGGRMERWMTLQQLRNTKLGFWKIFSYVPYSGAIVYPDSYKSVWGTGGSYDSFWGSGAVYAGMETKRDLQDSLNPFYNNSTNWFKYAFRTGKVLNANLQASGGTNNLQYMVGLGYYKETGIMINSAYARANFIANIQANVRKNMRLDSRVYASYVDRSSSGKLIKNRFEGMSVDPTQQPTTVGMSQTTEDVWLQTVNETETRSDDYRGMLNVLWEWELFNGLSFSASARVDYAQGNKNTFSPSTLDAKRHENKSEGEIGRNISLSCEELLHYNKSFREVHNLDVLLGMTATKDQRFSIGGAGRGSSSDYVYWYDPKENPAIRTYKTTWGETTESLTTYKSSFKEKSMVSYFGRLSYNYMQRYLLEATIRRDGSSTFGEGNKWADFPSIAVGWAFSQESFMQRFSWLDWGKLRFSYGSSGQIFTDEYLAHGLLKQSDLHYFNGNYGVVPYGCISPDLKWEKTSQYDLGLDLDLFNYRLNIKFDYYYKYTDQLIQNVGLPSQVNYFVNRTENAMAVSNEGWELEILYNVFRNKEFTWRSKLNVARNWNKFEKSYNRKDFGSQFVIGRSMYQILAYKDEGFYNSDDEVPIYYNAQGLKCYLDGNWAGSVSGKVGTYKRADLDGDNLIAGGDMYPAASPVTVAHGGWINELKWKNFEMNILFNYAIGRHIVNSKKHGSVLYGVLQPKYFDYRDIKIWTKPGDNDADYPIYGSHIPVLDSQIENVSSLSLKQITLSYDLPSNIVKKCSLSGIRFFITGENIFYWSNYSGGNPELIDVYSGMDDGRYYPLPQKWTLGLTLNF